MSRLFHKVVGKRRQEDASGAYQPLPKGDSIRYIDLKPGRPEEPLVCSLHISRLRQMRSVEAISYVWGSSARHCEITCNGETIYITSNLQTVLRRFRLLQESHTLWVDSICINQEDLAEKGLQIALMGRIYHKAKRVLIYLGDDHDGHAHAAASLLSELNEMVVKNAFGSYNRYPYLASDERDRLLADERWRPLLSMTRQPWFGRGWVVQEAGLAADAVIIWGDVEMSWQSVTRTWIWMSQRLQQLKTWYPNADLMNVAHLDLYRSRNRLEIRSLYPSSYSHDLDFLGFLQSCRQLGFKENSDRIYAFLSFTTEARFFFHDIRIDCSKSAEEVYLELARQYMKSKRKHSVDLLHYVQHTDTTVESQFPSWVPRWDINTYHAIAFHSTQVTFKSPLPNSASSDIRPQLCNNDVFRARGLLFDPVIHASKLFSMPVSIDEISSLWREVIRSFPTESPYQTTYKAIAFIQTICLNRILSPWSYVQKCRELYIRRLDGQEPQSEHEYKDILYFHEWVQSCVHNRRFIVTQRGYYGLAPRPVTKGDISGIIYGGKACVFLRDQPSKPDQYYKYLGDGVLTSKTVHGVVKDGGDVIMYPFGMSGGGQDWLEWGDVSDQDIYLC